MIEVSVVMTEAVTRGAKGVMVVVMVAVVVVEVVGGRAAMLLNFGWWCEWKMMEWQRMPSWQKETKAGT